MTEFIRYDANGQFDSAVHVLKDVGKVVVWDGTNKSTAYYTYSTWDNVVYVVGGIAIALAAIFTIVWLITTIVEHFKTVQDTEKLVLELQCRVDEVQEILEKPQRKRKK